MGAIKGDTLPKMYPYVRNILDNVKNQIGGNVFDYYLKDGVHGDIEIQPLESIRGRSLYSITILDESQLTKPDEMLAVVTRIEEGGKLIVIGDSTQKDVKGKSGLEWLVDFVHKHEIPNTYTLKEHNPESIVRSGFVRNILLAIEEEKRYVVD